VLTLAAGGPSRSTSRRARWSAQTASMRTLSQTGSQTWCATPSSLLQRQGERPCPRASAPLTTLSLLASDPAASRARDSVMRFCLGTIAHRSRALVTAWAGDLTAERRGTMRRRSGGRTRQRAHRHVGSSSRSSWLRRRCQNLLLQCRPHYSSRTRPRPFTSLTCPTSPSCHPKGRDQGETVPASSSASW